MRFQKSITAKLNKVEMHYFRAVIAVFVLVGGMLVPSGDLLLAAPAAVVAAFLLSWEIVRILPIVHRVVPFLVLLAGISSLQRWFAPPLSDYGHEKFVTFVTLTLLSAGIAALIRSVQDFLALSHIWVVAAAVLAVASFLTGDSVRTAAFGTNPIWASRAIAVGIVLLAWSYLNRHIRGILAFPLALILLVGLIVTGSRGPLFGAIAGVFLLFLTTRKGAVKNFFAMLLIGVGALILPTVPFFKESRLGKLSDGNILDDPIRGQLWNESWRLLKEYPGGVGYGNWSYMTVGTAQHIYPHNIFLEVLTEHGVFLGVVFALFVLLVLLRVVRRGLSDPVGQAVASWLLCEIINVSVSGDLNSRTFFFVLTLAFLSLADRTKQPEQSTRVSHGVSSNQ